MRYHNAIVFLARWLAVAVFVVAGSLLSTWLWKGQAETAHRPASLVCTMDMTVAEFGEKNNLPTPLLTEVFGLQAGIDLQKRLGDLGYPEQELVARVQKKAALHAEHQSKNWKKILVKFGGWIIFLSVVFRMLRRSGLTSRTRALLYFAAMVIFGVILGSDPAPMGTVKDAIVLFGAQRVIFPPRMIALSVFLLMVVLANKFICSWGCQVGTLQDLLFRFNRNNRDKPVLRQYRIPFKVSNTVRTIFFFIFTLVAMAWAFDIVAPVDPFKIFSPASLGIIGAISVGVILLISGFVYRPWCYLLCPFGLVSWLLERIALYKIRVDYGKCTSCEACSRACPSTVMGVILKRNATIPDCFACGSCIEACPTGAIEFGKGRRDFPPEGKFDRNLPTAAAPLSDVRASLYQ